MTDVLIAVMTQSYAADIVTSLGFRHTGSFQSLADGRSYDILVRPELAADAADG